MWRCIPSGFVATTGAQFADSAAIWESLAHTEWMYATAGGPRIPLAGVSSPNLNTGEERRWRPL
jgi:hypothetical protein